MEKPASTRQLKVAREIQKDLAEIIRAKGMATFGGALVTVSEVRVSPDLSVAKVFVSIFPSDKQSSVMQRLIPACHVLYDDGKLMRTQAFHAFHLVKQLSEISFRIAVSAPYYVQDPAVKAPYAVRHIPKVSKETVKELFVPLF